MINMLDTSTAAKFLRRRRGGNSESHHMQAARRIELLATALLAAVLPRRARTEVWPWFGRVVRFHCVGHGELL